MKNFQDAALEMGFDLSPETTLKFSCYNEELRLWNRKVNLTGHSKDEDLEVSLFLDSLDWGKALHSIKAKRVLDIGTGAGFPSPPLKIVFPELKMTLVEPTLKKAAFLHHIIGTLDLPDVTVVTERIEDLTKTPEYQGFFDYVVIKALRLDVFLPYLTPLLHGESEVVICRSQSLGNTKKLYGFEVTRQIPYELPSDYGHRTLTVLKPNFFSNGSNVPRGTKLV